VIYVIYLLCFSTGTLTTIVYDYLIRTDYVDEYELPVTMRTLSIFDKSFSFGEE
jgi:hypothetical protein